MDFKSLCYLISLIVLYVNDTLGWSFNLPKLSTPTFNAPSFSADPRCWVGECCREVHIPADIAKLRKVISERVYGQHLVSIAVDAIEAHWKGVTKPSKALTLSFHGWAGSGKNYVSHFIADSLYHFGTKSKFVHHFIGRMHFPLEEKTEQYKTELFHWVKTNTTICDKQLFIFDEVDKMPPGVLNVIKPIIDHKDVVDGVDFRNCIFIFISNTGSQLINHEYERLWHQGKQRESLRLQDFEHIIMKGAFNEKGGFHLSDAIKNNLIDHYIPFLPMEQVHIVGCIKDQFRERNIFNPKEEHIKEVLDTIEWGPDSSRLFSKTGCKRISSKVGVLATQYTSEREKSEL